MLLPYRVNTLTIRSPWANLIILGLNLLIFVLIVFEVVPEDLVIHLVLFDWSPTGLLSYQFLHAGIMHLIGNMILLWVFGNALSGVMHDHDYVATYLLCGIFAGALHLIVDGSPVVGASGAISGLMGLYLAVYPRNEVSCFAWLFRPGPLRLRATS